MAQKVHLITGSANPAAHDATVESLRASGAEVEIISAESWHTRMADYDSADSYIIDQAVEHEFPQALQCVNFFIAIGKGHTAVVLLVRRERLANLAHYEQRGVCVHPDDESMEAALKFLLHQSAEHHDHSHSKLIAAGLKP